MRRVETVLDRYAEGTPYEALARAFLEFDRWTGDDPILLLAEAAASTTGQRFRSGIKPTVERFREAFVSSGRVRTFTELAALDVDDDDLVEAFGAQRKRRVLCEGARVLAERAESDDLEALRGWAATADAYHYREDPIGKISGVGPASFQYLRMLAGIDTAKPDPQVTRFVDALASEVDTPYLDASEPLRAVASCEWLAVATDYRAIEVDQLAWWTYADEDAREAAIDDLGTAVE